MKAYDTAGKTAGTRTHGGIIPLRGCKNLRDLGGFVNSSGRTVRSGRIFRSGHLHDLTDEEAGFFLDRLNLKEVIDLRTPDEVAEKPDRIIPGIDYKEMPIVPRALMGITRESGTDVLSIIRRQKKTGQNFLDALSEKVPDVAALYASILNEPICREQLRNIMTAIFAQTNRGTAESVLFHCTIGKDRCGLVSMLLLALLGVPREDIVSDYLASNKVYRHKARKYYYAVLIVLRSKHMAVTLRDIHLAKKEYIASAIDSLLKLAGDKAGIPPEKLKECAAWYMTDILGIPDSEIARFRDVMLC